MDDVPPPTGPLVKGRRLMTALDADAVLAFIDRDRSPSSSCSSSLDKLERRMALREATRQAQRDGGLRQDELERIVSSPQQYADLCRGDARLREACALVPSLVSGLDVEQLERETSVEETQEVLAHTAPLAIDFYSPTAVDDIFGMLSDVGRAVPLSKVAQHVRVQELLGKEEDQSAAALAAETEWEEWEAKRGERESRVEAPNRMFYDSDVVSYPSLLGPDGAWGQPWHAPPLPSYITDSAAPDPTSLSFPLSPQEEEENLDVDSTPK